MQEQDWPVRGTLLADRYRLIEPCGVGGMSVVWRADDLLLDRPVAVKALAEPYAADIRLRSRIMKEARVAGRLSHPRITAVYDYGEAVRASGAKVPFVVMELLEGESLHTRLQRGPLRWEEAAKICADVAEALVQLHRHGVVHRDVTPGNIICGPTGIKILDFGISALVGEADDDGSGVTFGTIEYVAPERLDGAPASGATDIFALGVLLFELVSGRPPFPAQNWDELAAAYEGHPTAPPGPLPPPLDEICAWCLAMDPDQRPTATAASTALSTAVSTALNTAPSPPVEPDRAPSSDGGSSEEDSSGRRTHTVAGLHTPAHRRPRRFLPHRSLVPAVAFSALVLAVPATTVLPFLTPQRRERPPIIHVAPSARVTSPTATPGREDAPSAADAPSLARRSSAPLSPEPVDQTEDSEPPEPLRVPPGEAVERVQALVDDGAARKEIRPDVADDLGNLLGNLDRSVARRQDARAVAQVAELRRKVESRRREGSLSGELAQQLEAALGGVVASA